METPNKVKMTFESLRKSYGFAIILKRIKDHYYVYKETGKWDKELKKTKVHFEYLGRITEEGVFKKKVVTKTDELEYAKSIISAYGGKTIFPDKTEEIKEILSPSEETRRILTILSMNSRVSLKFLSKQTGLHTSTIYNKIKTLEQRYGIKYFAEIDVSKFGYFWYTSFVKFEDKIPNLDDIRVALEKEAHIQLAVLTTGEYDLIIYFLAKSTRDVAYYIYNLRSSDSLGKYNSDWHTTYLNVSNCIPIREQFFELLREKIWKRTKTKPRPDSNDILEREYTLLRELNRDGTADFTALDKRNNLGRGTSRYTYQRLLERGFLKRITANFEKLQMKYYSVLLLDIISGEKFSGTRAKLLLEIIEDDEMANKYVLAGDIGDPDGVILIAPVINNSSFIDTEEHIKNMVKGIRLRKLTVTDIVIGSFCNRRFDKTYSNQYKLLVEEYHISMDEKQINYDEKRKELVTA